VRWVLVIVVAALLGSLAFDLTGSSEIAYIVRSIARGLG